MSDDLVKRLQSLHKQATVERSHFYVGSCAEDAMHRIEELELAVRYEADLAQMALDARKELEAKLEKALELANLVEEFSDRALWKVVKQAVLELKGQDDE